VVYRFLNRFWKIILDCANNQKSSQEAIKEAHKLNQKITEDLEKMKFNTTVAAFMEFLNFTSDDKENIGREVIERILILFAPFAPHITEELWQKLGHQDSIHRQSWPEYDSELVKEKMVTLVIQINGKVRDKMEVRTDLSEKEAKELAISRKKVQKWLSGEEVKKTIFVPAKLINFVI
jgi:leucyl-tRNA synthetase